MKNISTKSLVEKAFVSLHEVPEIDQFLEMGQGYFKKKYGIDYFSVHMVHHSRSCLVGYYNHDAWHEFLYSTQQGVHQYSKGVFVRKNATIGQDEFYMEYFETYHNFSEGDQRAEIVGIRKYGGVTLIISDKEKNITVYDITFKNDSSLGTLNKQVLHNLIQDLIRYQPLLLPFINHAHQFGDFSDKYTLRQSMNQFMDMKPSLFSF